MIDAAAVEAYLHEHIPLSRHMQVRVAACDEAGVRLAAPLAANINHRGTVFGGSAAALAMLAGWGLVHARLAAGPTPARLVIRRCSTEFDRPIDGDVEAWCAPPAGGWRDFDADLAGKGKARVELQVELQRDGAAVGSFAGTYVAVAS